MRRIGAAPQWLVRAFIFFLVSNAHGLSITKDTVYESKLESPIWHDSLSLINTADDTLSMEGIYFIVPPGNSAHLRIGYKKPFNTYGKLSTVFGIVLQSGQRYDLVFASQKQILPHERIPITGFEMETCIECPTGGGFNPNAPQDTIRAYVVFETKVSRDTLVVIGTTSATSSGIRFQTPPAKSPARDGRKGFRQNRFYNGLGQAESEYPSSTEAPVIMKFRRKGEDRP